MGNGPGEEPRRSFISTDRGNERPLQSSEARRLPQQVHTAANATKNKARVANKSTKAVERRRGAPLLTFLGAAAVATAKLVTVLASRVFFPRGWPFIQTASLSTVFIEKHCSDLKISKAASLIWEPLHWLSGPVLWTTLCKHVLSWCWPDAYRTLQFWRRLLPIYTRYIITKWQVRNKSYSQREEAWEQTHEWGGKKVYELITDMSGYYVKSAQILASKGEFVPGAWARHLSKLLDRAPPRPFHEVEHTIRLQLRESQWGTTISKHKVGPPLDAVFTDLEKMPLASASIAQVHGGTLRDGTQIVVKVQHRGMETMMQSDLRNIAWVAKFLQGQLPVDLYPIVKEIQRTIPLEFNFEREVQFMDAIKGSMETNQFKQIVCPLPHGEFCTKKLIVMQRIDGVPFTEILHPSEGDLHPRLSEAMQALRHLLEAYGQMIFVDGIFHADPHAGNLFLLPDGKLGLLDYGQSKEIDRGLRRKLAQMTVALHNGNSLAIALALLDIGVVFEAADAKNYTLDRVATAARILFDVCHVEEANVSPMSQNSILKELPLKRFNQEIWMVIRTNLLLRGLCFSLKMDISATEIWLSYAMIAMQSA